ncbi:MAG: drug/metabolite transporter (DMT)-like permease [Pseudoalteromonas rhizosphaerae]|jgi:drug/metabolite transporter (DMT)-like permease|uniref:DMT family transporter n=1 Tax=Pseudoalteromonas TaxID=53246 RepID=UPI0016044D72|nr:MULTISPECIES: DMT family transporter [Pseudoalteromonas]MBB1301727.1 DMT family transporter [Pseudoalteromonas sp. SR44-8]MBB1310116.1 DMT family transporter [Pseudoalteromonas sp. SR41-8]MBB1398185.1 DMT family transporter [Pseudoalteromonas sp. SG44-8]MBB1410636.1 DMT family transporter [Pseudoalteromonas sp. SG44-17]MBB1505449.1 DMT family transporter [Pseudoalteromonas sp. SG41-1]|tara:strand:+ start:6461 stop:7327 length:867 start_codon:yes stop_codon:yes gene_type:complete
MQAQQQSLVYLHIAVLLFGGTALFAKLINLNALDITVYRAAIAGLAIMILLLWQKKAIKLSCAKDYLIALLLGAAVGIHWVTYFAGMQMAGIAVGMIAFFTYPVITVFIEPFFNGSKPKVNDLLSAGVVITGIYLLTPNADMGNDVTLGVVTGVISAFFFAFRNIVHKRYFSHYGGPQTMFYQTLVASLLLCAFIEVPVINISNQDLGLLLVAGVIFTATPHSLFAASLQYLSASTAGLISCLQPLYGTFLAFLLLHEQPSLQTLLGGALVISAAFYETWSVTRKHTL